ncbi:phosphoribosylglycinamide formyltransferase [Desulfuromonas carbonis]|uniref:phosphoribosylglycinamide formyltransferase n=1 Tax=Desulfuromonas sp. DDH964 TaxID=1823759 RepID=UPI00078B66E2|nr:phosphoribosylglycinamide formyltransferase [Desulfuromonas sp. DDH964]AMV72631.1 phosphoribosylglycinamide formyltransferase, folate-dependent [Desulfuromonas sp. DDH964]
MAGSMRISVLASGGGTNLQALIDHAAAGSLGADIGLVLSNNPQAGALERARKAGIATCCIDHRQFAGREEFDRAVVAALEDAGTGLVVLAGFMRILSPVFIDAFPGRIMNIHPALLPAFPGLHVQRKAIEYGARFAGCTVHFVDGGVDTGPIIIQAVVPVHEDDSEATLAARILEQEHRIYPEAIRLFAAGRLQIDGRKVRISPPAALPSGVLINPPLASAT